MNNKDVHFYLTVGHYEKNLMLDSSVLCLSRVFLC